MKRVSSLFSILVLFLILVYLMVFVVYPYWGRRVIYSNTSSMTKFLGIGKEIVLEHEQIWVSPVEEGVPFFDTVGNKGEYETLNYRITDMLGKENLQYVVGQVMSWESIPDSSDKYLVLRISNKRETEKYRIGFEASTMYDVSGKISTLLWVENTGIKVEPANKYKQFVPPNLADLGFGVINKIIKTGDVVVLIPVFDPPYYAKKDDNGYYSALKIIVRRVGGMSSLAGEIEKAKIQ